MCSLGGSTPPLSLPRCKGTDEEHVPLVCGTTPHTHTHAHTHTHTHTGCSVAIPAILGCLAVLFHRAGFYLLVSGMWGCCGRYASHMAPKRLPCCQGRKWGKRPICISPLWSASSAGGGGVVNENFYALGIRFCTIDSVFVFLTAVGVTLLTVPP